MRGDARFAVASSFFLQGCNMHLQGYKRLYSCSVLPLGGEHRQEEQEAYTKSPVTCVQLHER